MLATAGKGRSLARPRRCSSVTDRCGYAPSSRLVAGPNLSLRHSRSFMRWLLVLSGCRVDIFLVMLGHARFDFVAAMIVKAVAEGDAVAGRKGEITRALWLIFEIVEAEGVGREQAVIPHMPRSRVAEVVR